MLRLTEEGRRAALASFYSGYEEVLAARPSSLAGPHAAWLRWLQAENRASCLAAPSVLRRW